MTRRFLMARLILADQLRFEIETARPYKLLTFAVPSPKIVHFLKDLFSQYSVLALRLCVFA